jgi:hypothetical protein
MRPPITAKPPTTPPTIAPIGVLELLCDPIVVVDVEVEEAPPAPTVVVLVVGGV